MSTTPADKQIPSWDADRDTAPDRPILPIGISNETRIEQPKRVLVGVLLVVVGALSFISVLVIAFLHLEEIREGFISVLNENLDDDYADEDKENAVHILLGILGGVALLITLGVLIAANTVRASKNSVARIFVIVLTLFYLPSAFLTSTLREDNWLELTLGGVAAVCFTVAAILFFTPRVSTWLRQSEKAPPKPLVDFTDTSGKPIVSPAPGPASPKN